MADPVRDFLMDANGDLAAVGGDFATVAGAEAVPQGIKVRVRSFLGEIYLDEAQGIDYLGTVLEKGTDPLVARELVAEAIVDTPDVTSVVGAEIVVDAARQATVNYQATTIYSEVPAVDQVKVP